jgi:putative spermidine/putrescine transport system ATP-binding protein
MTSKQTAGALELREVVKHYGDEVAVDGVSLFVEPGEFITLLGPSGSGKTTTLAMIAGFTRPDSGLISLDGSDITNLPPHRRDIGMVFQNYALFPHMTAAENIAFPLQMRKVPKQRATEMVEAVLEKVQLPGRGHRYPRELSGGQQQRVALARAVVFDPRLLLMDEPLGALDRQLREMLQLEIMRFSRELGITVLYVTHDQEEALVMSDRIVIYNNGLIEQIGSAETLYEQPASRFVAEFIGESNIFEGTIERSSQTLRLQSGERLSLDPDQLRAAKLGSRAAVVVRPEHVEIDEHFPPGEAHIGAVLNGRLREAIYLGPTVKCIVELASGQAVSARVRPNVWVRQRIATGAEVSVRWLREHGVVVRASSPHELEPKSVEATVSAESPGLETGAAVK